jgi:hypothetical protein
VFNDAAYKSLGDDIKWLLKSPNRDNTLELHAYRCDKSFFINQTWEKKIIRL